MDDFAKSLDLADEVYLTNIFGSIRENHGDITSKDLGDKIPADKKSQIESALTKLKEAHKNQDIDAIDATMKELETAFHAASQDIYNAQQQAGAQQQGPQPGANQGAQQGGNNNGDNVTDVPFEEV